MAFPAQEVLITEHLTFPPLSLIDDIINTANALLYKSVSAIETLFRTLPADAMPDDELETGIHKFETLLESAVDRNFDAFELFVLRNIVHIPADLLGHVKLAHQEDIDVVGAAPGSGANEEIDEELARARRTYAAELRVRQALLRENAAIARQSELLMKHSAELTFLETAAKAAEVAPVRDNVEFLQEQVHALKGGLSEVKKLTNKTLILDRLEQTERSQYIEKVLLETVPEGSYEREAADLQAIGSADDLQSATDLLRRQGSSTG
ncbi:hypothetical protein PYCC9005_003570 [Savitreella phatthalungensis]